jgi:hypothetical protein
MVPRWAIQVTDLLLELPWTVAENCIVPSVVTDGADGETLTELTGAEAVPEGGVDEDVAAVALNGTTTGLAPALVKIVRLPVAFPGVVAANTTSKFWLAPGARLPGTARPLVLKLKPGPVTVTWLIATPVVSWLVAVIVCEPVVPTTVETDTLLGVTASAAGCDTGIVLALEDVTPTQPEDQQHVANSKAKSNTETAPRFENEKFNVDRPFPRCLYGAARTEFVSRATWCALRPKLSGC